MKSVYNHTDLLRLFTKQSTKINYLFYFLPSLCVLFFIFLLFPFLSFYLCTFQVILFWTVRHIVPSAVLYFPFCRIKHLWMCSLYFCQYHFYFYIFYVCLNLFFSSKKKSITKHLVNYTYSWYIRIMSPQISDNVMVWQSSFPLVLLATMSRG